MKLEIIPMHHPLLRQKTKTITQEQFDDPQFHAHCEQMWAIYNENPAVGFAAPQVGWNARAFIMGFNLEHSRGDQQAMPPTLFVNPEIDIIQKKTQTDWEGCFSVFHEDQDIRLAGEVARARGIRILAYNQQGTQIEQEFHNFHARVFQHETDHLDGIRFINRMTDNAYLLYTHDQHDHKIRMRDIPKQIHSQHLSQLRKLIPCLLKAPICTLSLKTQKRLAQAYRDTAPK